MGREERSPPTRRHDGRRYEDEGDRRGSSHRSRGQDEYRRREDSEERHRSYRGDSEEKHRSYRGDSEEKHRSYRGDSEGASSIRQDHRHHKHNHRLDEDSDRKRHRRDHSRSRSPGHKRVREAPKASTLLDTVPLHPLLMADSAAKAALPQPTMTSMANVRAAAERAANNALNVTKKTTAKQPTKEQPPDDRVAKFLAIKPEEDAATGPFHDRRLNAAVSRRRKGGVNNAFAFCPRGKFTRQAEHMRTQAEMELLRRQVAAESRMAGLELVSDRLTRGPDQIPEYDWWDVPFALGDLSLLNNLVQRPPLISAVVEDAFASAPKPLHLTPQERKKLRRIRRLEEQRERQDLIQAGLLPADQPRMKLANLPRLLAGADGIAGPSSLEAEVRASVEARHQQHMEANEARRVEAAAESARPTNTTRTDGPVAVAVYLLAGEVSLVGEAAGPLRFKLAMNARQNHLTGCALVYREECSAAPTGFTVIVVEGRQGDAGLNRYKNLLMNRIKWNQHIQPETTLKVPLIQLIWEGNARSPAFERFSIIDKITSCLEAADFFTHRQVEQYWRLAESMARTSNYNNT